MMMMMMMVIIIIIIIIIHHYHKNHHHHHHHQHQHHHHHCFTSRSPPIPEVEEAVVCTAHEHGGALGGLPDRSTVNNGAMPGDVPLKLAPAISSHQAALHPDLNEQQCTALDISRNCGLY